MRIFKFTEVGSDAYAFVICNSLKGAEQILKDQTLLPIVFIESHGLEEVPAALEHYERRGQSVWINHIKPF